jgi:Rod binding domain-containing protein
MNGKGFQQRLYYDAFLENLSRHLALNGGVGIAQFILKNLKD